MKAIYLGPQNRKKVWHHGAQDADGSCYEFQRTIPLMVPDSLADTLNAAPNFRIDDGTVFINDAELLAMHDEGRPVSILLIRYLGGIGDILMVTPAIRGVREKFPNAEITFAINKSYFNGTLYEVLEHNPHIDKFINATNMKIDQKSAYTSWIDLSHPCARYEAATTPNVDLHRTEIYCDECGVQPSSYKPEIYLTPEDEEHAMSFYSAFNLYDSKVVLMQPFAADLRRTWGVDRMFEVAKAIGDAKFLWIDYHTRLPKDAPPNMLDAGKMEIRQLAAVAKRADAILGNDSFLLQLGAAFDVPTVAIFGATNPHMRCKFHKYYYTAWNVDECKNTPCWYGYPCLNTHLKNLGNLVVLDKDGEQLKNRLCIESVTVEQVSDLLQKAFRKEIMPYVGQKVSSSIGT